MADLIYDLTRWLLDTRYEDLPPEAVEAAKRGILDTLGVTVAGSKAEGCEAVVGLVREWGGKPESTIIVHGGKVPANLAGLAFGTMARARDLGDVHEKVGCHVDEYILPAAFPLVERMGAVSGKDFLTALVLGEELLIRLTVPLRLGHRTNITGRDLGKIFGPTATCAKLLDFDEEEMVNAFGLAYAQKIGDVQAYEDGALTVRVQHGIIADAAIKSVLLVERGITGTKNVLQGRYGYFRSIEPGHDQTVITSKLGKTFQSALTGYKQYSCCNCTHTAIDATIALVKEHDIKPEDVEEVQIDTNKVNLFVSEPAEVKSNPQNVVECQFSMPYCVSTAIVKRDAFIDDFTPEAINRPKVRALLPKVKTRIAPEIADWAGVGPAIVTIKMKNGKEYTRRVDYKKGHPNNPLSMNELEDKFRRCMPFSVKPIPAENINKVVEMVRSLEKFNDVTPLVELLTP